MHILVVVVAVFEREYKFILGYIRKEYKFFCDWPIFIFGNMNVIREFDAVFGR